ncbi:hypothetical protein TNCV_2619661 [Trichonephila clavipes]|uniref:Uncharacterized protein n=1 Tax=Trichonephila clavipes TaxID=2585209 RepID=A0A8X7BMJ5_TRICX|nr:hypothetical protein TNCV_2619661 [Trichonephila clavipes]
MTTRLPRPHTSRKGRGSRVVKVTDRSLPRQEFEPSTSKDPPCRAMMHAKSVESSNVFPLGITPTTFDTARNPSIPTPRTGCNSRIKRPTAAISSIETNRHHASAEWKTPLLPCPAS